MRKAARPLGSVDSLNPRRWRGERLHHRGGGVCWLFVLLWMDSWHHKLIVCKIWYKNNLKMRLTALLFDPPTRAPYPSALSKAIPHCKYFMYTTLFFSPMTLTLLHLHSYPSTTIFCLFLLRWETEVSFILFVADDDTSLNSSFFPSWNDSMTLLSFSPMVALVSTDILQPKLLDKDFFDTPDLCIYFGTCTVGGEGSSNMWRYLDTLPIAPRQLYIDDEQESHNQDADISAVQVQDSYRRLLVPSFRHDLAHDPPLLEDLVNWCQWYLHLDLSCALDYDKWVMQSLLLVSLPSFFWQIHICNITGYGGVDGGGGGCLWCTLIIRWCSWCACNGFVWWKVIDCCRFCFRFSFFLCLSFVDAIGSSSNVESVDPRLDQAIKVFAACCCAYGWGHILWIVQYLEQWWFMV